MLNGERVLLRATTRDDVPMFHRLESDADLQQVTNSRPWRPESLEAAYARFDKELGEVDPTIAVFTIVPRDRADDPAGGVGYGLLWGIDVHHRAAHLGITLVPEARGQGFGLDAVRVLLDYGFRIRALLRIGCETLTTNTGMIALAEAAGFVREGVHRSVGYLDGERVDEMVFGLLYEEWNQK
jgi:RimJ/RimL family protein N-acetyltransferase